jgi:hypothetical protein
MGVIRCAALFVGAACSTADRRTPTESPPPAKTATVARDAVATAADADLEGPCPPGTLTVDDSSAPILGVSAITIVDAAKVEVAAQLLIWFEGNPVPTCADLEPGGRFPHAQYVRLSRALDDARPLGRTWAGGTDSGKRSAPQLTIERRDEHATTLCVRSPVIVESKSARATHRVIAVGAFTGENCGTRSW